MQDKKTVKIKKYDGVWEKLKKSPKLKKAQEKANADAQKYAKNTMNKAYPYEYTNQEPSKKTEQKEQLYSSKPIIVTEQTEVYADVWFVDGLLIKGHHNLMGGPTKIGKSLGLLEIVIGRLRELNIKKNKKDFIKGIIISTENSKNTLAKQMLVKDAYDFMQIGDPNMLKKFNKDIKYPTEKIDEVYKRIKYLLELGFKVILIDPAPRFFKWNDESLVIQYIDGLEELADQYGACIVSVRNDGKTKYEQAHSMKGTSGAEDDIRLLLRALSVYPNSVIGKLVMDKYKKEKKEDLKGKIFVLTSHYAQNLMPDPKAFAFIIQSSKLKNTSINVPIATKFMQIEPKYLSKLEPFCSVKSAMNDTQLIYREIKEGCGISKEELKNTLPHIKDITKPLDRLKKREAIIETEGTFYPNIKS